MPEKAKLEKKTKRVIGVPVETWQKINIIKAVGGWRTVSDAIEATVDEVYANLKLPK